MPKRYDCERGLCAGGRYILIYDISTLYWRRCLKYVFLHFLYLGRDLKDVFQHFFLLSVNRGGPGSPL
jgi:hypothetical protein